MCPCQCLLNTSTFDSKSRGRGTCPAVRSIEGVRVIWDPLNTVYFFSVTRYRLSQNPDMSNFFPFPLRAKDTEFMQTFLTTCSSYIYKQERDAGVFRTKKFDNKIIIVSQ